MENCLENIGNKENEVDRKSGRKSSMAAMKKVNFADHSMDSDGGKKKLPISSGSNNNGSNNCKQKRLSFSLRGKRKSSFHDLQTSIHPEISPEDFHKHVNGSLPDPLRLRQIVVYAIDHYLSTTPYSSRLQQQQESGNKCGSSSRKSNGSSSAKDLEANELKSLLKLLLEKSVSTSWFSRPRSGNEGMVVSLPNPANAELKARIAGYRAILDELSKNNEDLARCKANISSTSTCASTTTVTPVTLPEQQLPEALLASAISNNSNNAPLALTIIPPAPSVSVQQTLDCLREFDRKLKLIDSFVRIHSMNLNLMFTQAIECCWDDDESEQNGSSDSHNSLMLPFAQKYAKAGRRLSFNIQKTDKCAKILRALSVTK